MPAALSLQTLIYLRRPQMSAGFAVSVVRLEGQAGHIEGQDVQRLAKFLRVSEGVPQFDLEHEGQLFEHCRLTSEASSTFIAFSFESVSVLAPSESDPNASYT